MSTRPRLERDDCSSNRHLALEYRWRRDGAGITARARTKHHNLPSVILRLRGEQRRHARRLHHSVPKLFKPGEVAGCGSQPSSVRVTKSWRPHLASAQCTSCIGPDLVLDRISGERRIGGSMSARRYPRQRTMSSPNVATSLRDDECTTTSSRSRISRIECRVASDR